MRQKDPIYETIKDAKENSNIDYVNAEITEENIIPGINGLVVNVDKSFQKMKAFGAFNKYYLIYDQIKPDISLEDNKDKIIQKGNAKKKSVALVLSSSKIANIIEKENIKASILINQEDFQRASTFEQINNDSKKFKETANLLNSINQNKNICVINKYNSETCKKNKQYLVKPTLELTSSNIASIKGKIESGSIILIQSNVKKSDLQILIKQIEYQGLSFVTLSEMINEVNNKN